MIAPTMWFIFAMYMEDEIELAGSFENAIVQLHQNLTQEERVEMLAFFDLASKASDEECRTLEMKGSDQRVYFDFPDSSCEEFYSGVAKLFIASE